MLELGQLVDRRPLVEAVGPTLEVKEVVFAACGYEPYPPEQREAHAWTGRCVMVVGGERSGKSTTLGAEAVVTAMLGGRVAMCAQAYDQTRKECETAIELLRACGAIQGKPSTPNVGQWIIKTVQGGVIETISLRDGPGELTATGRPYDLVVLCEAGRIAYDCFIAAWGRIAETNGRIAMGGTLWDDFGWYADFDEVFSGPNVFDGRRYTMPSWANPYAFPGGEGDPLIAAWRATMQPDEAARRIDAKLIPSPARALPEFNRGVHVSPRPLVIEPDLPVELCVDPGYDPSYYAVGVFQDKKDAMGRECVRLVREIYDLHVTHPEMAEKCMKQPWWKQVETIRGGHEMLQHAMGGTPPADTWKKVTGKTVQVVPKHDLRDRVSRMRNFLRDPASREPRFICDVSCHNTQKEAASWKKRTDRDGKVVDDRPEDKPTTLNHMMAVIGNHVVGKYGSADPNKREPERRGKHRATPMG